MDVHGFAEENIDLLMDDGAHTNPTKDNIIDAFKKLAGTSEPGDVVYVQFSGKVNNTFYTPGERYFFMDISFFLYVLKFK